MSPTYSERILQYCYNVVNDSLPNRGSCTYEKLACQRHLDDLSKQDDSEYPFYFDEDAANKRCYFTECLQHTKGKWRGQLIRLEDHQLFIQGVLFGWMKKSSDTRRFTKAFIELTRKSGKSIEAATTGIYMGFADDEPGAEVYSGAQTEAQALCVFRPAYDMVRQNEDLLDYFDLTLAGTIKNPTSIYRESDMSVFTPLVGKPGDGASPHCALVDEYHEAKTSELYDAMDTGMGARTSPLLIVITTAGVNTSYPCYDLHLESVKVLEGTIKNDSLFCMIFAPDKDDDWKDFEVWKKVNPNYGVSIDRDYLYGKFQDALNKPTQRNILLTKHLNIWQNSGVAAFDMLRWQECEDTSLTLEDFEGQECVAAFDFASKIDICALVLLFKYKRKVINSNCPKCFGEVVIRDGMNICISGKMLDEDVACEWKKPVLRNCVVGFAKHYLPEETVNRKENQHYQKWAMEGWLISTPGERTDFHQVEEELEELSKHHNIKELVYDPKEASYLIQNIQVWAGFDCIEYTQSPAMMSEPMKELEAMICAYEFWHCGDPVYTWNIGNVIKKQARGGGDTKHYFPTKQNPELKIDSGVATIMGLGRLITYEDDGGAYESRADGDGPVLRVL